MRRAVAARYVLARRFSDLGFTIVEAAFARIRDPDDRLRRPGRRPRLTDSGEKPREFLRTLFRRYGRTLAAERQTLI
jgi:hypothetical protein